jgi:hypothetical protein
MTKTTFVRAATVLLIGATGFALIPSAARANGPFGQEAPIAGLTCSRPSDCTSPLVCRSGRCTAECLADRDCSCPNTHCVKNAAGVGACVVNTLTIPRVPAACVNAFDCDSNRCVNGRCG